MHNWKKNANYPGPDILPCFHAAVFYLSQRSWLFLLAEDQVHSVFPNLANLARMLRSAKLVPEQRKRCLLPLLDSHYPNEQAVT